MFTKKIVFFDSVLYPIRKFRLDFKKGVKVAGIEGRDGGAVKAGADDRDVLHTCPLSVSG